MRHKLTWIIIILAILITVLPVAVYGSNSATQNASTKNISAISIKAQDYSSDVTSITFPAAAPGSTASNPYNNVNGVNNPQSFSSSPGSAIPVITLVNTDQSYEFVIYYQISSWTNNVVSSEYILINDKGAACAGASAINTAVTFNTPVNSSKIISPAVAGDLSKKDVYLKVVLENTGGLNGSSTITILSEVP